MRDDVCTVPTPQPRTVVCAARDHTARAGSLRTTSPTPSPSTSITTESGLPSPSVSMAISSGTLENRSMQVFLMAARSSSMFAASSHCLPLDAARHR